MSFLVQKHCQPCKGDTAPFTLKEANKLSQQIPGWIIKVGTKGIHTPHPERLHRTFTFKNFKETMVFVDKVAELAEEENHHPDLAISYGKCVITIRTHAIEGLSENDFILAAKIDAL